MPSSADAIPSDTPNTNQAQKPIDLSVATGATRIALRRLLEVMIFESEPPAADRDGRRRRPGGRRQAAATEKAQSAGLQVFHAYYRWFAAWRLPPKEAAGLPPEQRVQLKTVHDDPASEWGIVLHEV